MHRTTSRRTAFAAVGLAVCAALLCSCTGGSGGSGPTTTAPTGSGSVGSAQSRLGAFPIPSPPPVQPTPVASLHHPQLLAIGEPVRVNLPGVTATVTALGPYELTPYRGGATLPTSTVGIITIVVAPTHGSLTLRAADFLSRGETGKRFGLRPHGPTTVTATVSHPAKLKVQGRFTSGAAQVTWHHQGDVLAIWDFNVELD